MQLELTTEDRTFQDEVRTFVHGFREPGALSSPDESLLARWKPALIERGWQAFRWPKQFGGTGWSVTEKYIWEREGSSVALPPEIGGMGIAMIGPILCGDGTDEQRARHLPGILDGSVPCHWWRRALGPFRCRHQAHRQPDSRHVDAAHAARHHEFSGH